MAQNNISHIDPFSLRELEEIRRQDVSDALKKLSDTQYIIIKQRFWEGSSFESIAKQLGKMESEVISTYKVALQELRHHLIKYNPKK